jgi:hypothetical protein
MTRVFPVPLVLPVAVPLLLGVDPGAALVLGLDEHAAMPAAVTTTAAAAMNRL